MSNSSSGTVINYGSGSDFLTSYGSGSGSTSQKVTVPSVPVPVPVPQHCYAGLLPERLVDLPDGGLRAVLLPGQLISGEDGGEDEVALEYAALCQPRRVVQQVRQVQLRVLAPHHQAGTEGEGARSEGRQQGGRVLRTHGLQNSLQAYQQVHPETE
jgi:hypothetical protein